MLSLMAQNATQMFKFFLGSIFLDIAALAFYDIGLFQPPRTEHLLTSLAVMENLLTL